MNLTPLYDHILVQRKAVKETEDGGVIVKPEMAMRKEIPSEGEVIAVGPGKEKPLTVKVGDNIIFGKYTGTEITLDKDVFVVLREDEVFGIISE